MTIATIKKLESKVEKGVTWLDENKPSWYKKVELDILDLGEGDSCVLGQIYGTFWKIFINDEGENEESRDIVSNGMTPKESIAHGFYADADSRENYDILTNLWWCKIYSLRKGKQ